MCGEKITISLAAILSFKERLLELLRATDW